MSCVGISNPRGWDWKGKVKTMTEDQVISRLKTHVSSLLDLLNDPRPDLRAWCLARARECQAIADYWGGKWADDDD